MNDKERTELETFLKWASIQKAEEGLLLTLYVPPTDIERARTFLRSEQIEAGNIRDRVTRKMVSDALYDAQRALLYPLGLRGRANGVVVFADGSGASASFEPPEPILGFLYKCERTYFLEPLEDMLVERHIIALVVLDRGEATLGWTDGRRIVLLRNLESYIMKKHHKGGMSQARYARMTQQQLEAFFTKIGEAVTETFLPMLDRVDAVYIGGPALTKDEFVRGDYFDYRIRAKIRPEFHSTGYTDEQGLRELCFRAGLVKA
jgi:peptide chain release factor subunit 1